MANGGLFDKDPVFRNHRDSRGRFCTAERAEYERVKQENSMLRMELQKLMDKLAYWRRQADVSNEQFIEIMRRMKSKN
jgi:transcriptional regulator NrdR family protein